MTLMTGLRMTAGGGRRASGSRRARAFVVVAAVSCGALLAGTGLASAAASAPTAAPRVHWGLAEEVPGLGALNAGGNAAVNSVSCWRQDDCAAGGFYTDASGHQQAFVVTEHNGVWGQAAEVPGTAALNGDTSASSAQVSALSCAPSGYCAAAGDYDSAGTQQVFVVSETNGRWGTAREIPGVGKLNVGGDAAVNTVSCPSAGNCAAGGYYQTAVPEGTPIGQDSQAFVVSQTHGRWATAEEVPGMEALSPPPFQVNVVDTVSCASAGNCTAGGFWAAGPNGAPGHGQSGGFMVSEVNGRWHQLVLPTGGGGSRWVSCWHAGDCVSAGTDRVNIQTNGRWGKTLTFAALSSKPILAISCPSAGNCTLGGVLGYYPVDQFELPSGGYVLNERNGHWGKAIGVAGPANLGQIDLMSCPSAGNCGAAGNANPSFDNEGNPISSAFVVGERDDRWATSEQPPGLPKLNAGDNSSVNSVSCPSASACTAGGSYTDASGHSQAWVDG